MRLKPIFALFIFIFLFFSCQQKKNYPQLFNDANTYFERSWIKVTQNKPKEAFGFIDSLWQILPVEKQNEACYRLGFLYNKFSIINLLNNRDFYNNGDAVLLYSDSILLYMNQQHLAEKLPDVYSSQMLQKADALFRMHQPEKANELFYQIELFSKNYNDICTQAHTAGKMAFISYRQKDFQQALAGFQQTYLLQKKCTPDDYFSITQAIDDIALCFSKLNNQDSSIYYYNKALIYISERKDLGRLIKPSIITAKDSRLAADRSISVILGNLAHSYQLKGAIDTAIDLSIKSITLNATVCCEERDAQLTSMRLIDMYYLKKDFSKMYQHLLLLRKGLDSLPNTEPELNWHRQMAEYNDAFQHDDLAYGYFKMYQKMKDSLNSLTEKDKTSNIVKDLQFKSKGTDLNLLKKDNELNKLYLWITIGVICLALILISFVYFNFKKSTAINTTLKELNKQVSAQKNDLENANIEKDRILYIVAEDLKNPIGGLADLANEILGHDGLTQSSKPFIQMIQKTASNALSLINELLQTHQTTNESLNFVVTNMHELVTQTVFLLDYKAKEKQQKIIAQSEGNSLNITIDALKIGRVLENLISNAIKFSPQNSTIIVNMKKQQNTLLLSVKDTGIGIPLEQQKQVFDMFSNIKREGTSGEKSFGLGLSICKQIVEAHGGKIYFISIPFEGSTFYFELPMSTI